MKMLISLVLLLASPALFAKAISTTEQKMDYARKFVAARAAQHGFTLVDGSLDLHASNSPVAATKLLVDLGYTLLHLERTGKFADLEYVDFILTDRSGRRFSGYYYLFSTWDQGAGTDSGLATMNPVTGRKIIIGLANRELRGSEDIVVNLSEKAN